MLVGLGLRHRLGAGLGHAGQSGVGVVAKRRCLVPIEAFYQWKKLDAKTKQPYAIALAGGGFMSLAGLWENWKSPAGSGSGVSRS